MLFHMAFIDPLTQIGNYHSFYTACEKQLHNGGSKSCALYYFDIDNFKLINDTFEFAGVLQNWEYLNCPVAYAIILLDKKTIWFYRTKRKPRSCNSGAFFSLSGGTGRG